jgi:hypothetical protein
MFLFIAARADGAEPPIHFWFSTSATASNGPEAPQVALTAGNRTTLYLWCRPSTRASLRNFSLNVVASSPGIDLFDGTFSVLNDATSSTNRFEFVNDSLSTPPLVSEFTEAQSFANADSLLNLQGFTVFSPDAAGVGPNCSGGALHCHTATDGKPNWLLGSIAVKGLTIGTVAQLFLQVGDVGMNQEIFPVGDYDTSGLVNIDDFDAWKRNFGSTLSRDADGNGDGIVNAADYSLWRDRLGATSVIENSAATLARFGLDPTPTTSQPTYNTLSHRGITLAGDDPDAVITVAGPAAGAGGVAAPEPAVGTLVGWLLLVAASGRLKRVSRCRPGARHAKCAWAARP